MAKKDILFRSKLKKAKKLLEQNQLDQAEPVLKQLVRGFPRVAEVWLACGVLEGKRGDHAAAAQGLGKAAELQPGNGAIQYNYGIALRDSGDIKAALPVFRKAVSLEPGNTEALDCLAHAYLSTGDLDRAIEIFSLALQQSPQAAETHSNLGSVYQAKGMLYEAEAGYRKALACKPDIEIADNLGSVLVSQGRFEEALQVYRTGLARQARKDKVLSNLLLTLNYLPDADQAEILAEHKKVNGLFAGLPRYSHDKPGGKKNRRIRVGYVSPDFREHSVAHFIEPLLAGYDREQFEVWAFSATTREDATTQRLRSLVEHWEDISRLPPRETATRVHECGIDILVDLAGHTACNSLAVFAMKPAPVQLTWLGYPNTTGLNEMDYRLVDNIVDPPGQDAYYTEQLIRLPGCFLCYQPASDAPVVAPLPALENGFVTFGSFNNLAKINDRVIDLWAAVLKAVPDSRLLIKNPSLTDAGTAERYREKFLAAGIDEQRLTLMGHTKTRQDHLALYARVDIGLDTFPYNGTTTTCEALWMGVPVITLAGQYHAGRVGASLLEAAGYGEWVVETPQKFVGNTAGLAGDPERLQGIRENLRSQMRTSALSDAAGFAGKVETVYTDIMKHWGGK